LRINCGLRIADLGFAGRTPIPQSNPQSAIHN
jgi:hypothetical protein